MAAAYRALDRVHPPLTSPLEDLNPTTAHLKLHWVSSLQRLQECTLSSAFTGGLPYPRPVDEERTQPFDTDELIVLNIYKTNEPSTSYGLGPSPLSPVYLFYPTLHPADHQLRPFPCGVKLEGKKGAFMSFFSLSKKGKETQLQYEYGKIPRPYLIQSFLDRKDLSTLISTTVACVRFYEGFVEWRLVPPPFVRKVLRDDNSDIVTDVTRTYTLARSASRAASRGEGTFRKTFSFASLNLRASRHLSNSMPIISGIMKGKMKEVASADDIGIAKTQIVKPKDVVAARIYLKPNIRLVERPQKSRSFPFFGTPQPGNSSYQTPVYTTLEELGGGVTPSLEVHFSGSSSAVTKTYWWTCGGVTWKIVFDERDELEMKSKRFRKFYGSGSNSAGQPEAGPSHTTTTSENSTSSSLKGLFTRPKAHEKVVQMFPDVSGGTVRVYAGEVGDPVGYVELLTGQMWLVQYIPLETTDIIIALTFAVVNLEKSVRAEHNKLRDLQGGRSEEALQKPAKWFKRSGSLLDG